MKFLALIFFMLLTTKLAGQDALRYFLDQLKTLKDEHYSLFFTTSNTDELLSSAENIHERAEKLDDAVKEFIDDNNEYSINFKRLAKESYDFANFTDGLGTCQCYKMFNRFLEQYRAEKKYIATSEGVNLHSSVIGNYIIYYISSGHQYSATVKISYNKSMTSSVRTVGLWNETEIIHITTLNDPIKNITIAAQITNRTSSDDRCYPW
jgi:hypothetical protein